MLHAHETSLTWKGTNIFNNANLCTPKNVAKNNDHAASVVALVHAHTNILADHVTRSISLASKKLVTCLVASLASARKRMHLG